MKRTAAVITVSDKSARGERVDTSGPKLCALLAEDGWQVVHTAIVPDERDEIGSALRFCADEKGVALILTTGGTGFSPRDITPEATLEVLEREAPGLSEQMRAESMRITPHGCLSRGISGIRKRTLIVNLPGSEKAAQENYRAIRQALPHGVKMLFSEGSAECAAGGKEKAPSMDVWLREAKLEKDAPRCGMYLFHNGVVRSSARAQVREGRDAPAVSAMAFDYDEAAVAHAVEQARGRAGIYCVRTWLNRGELQVGDDLMLVLVGGDTRDHVVETLTELVTALKRDCVREVERY